MPWLAFVVWFFGGAFVVNAIPHFLSGVLGRPFPSPFASPPGKGLSSPIVNVLWGAFNLLVAYLLLCRVHEIHLDQTLDVLVFGTGGLLMAVMLALTFGRTQSNQ